MLKYTQFTYSPVINIDFYILTTWSDRRRNTLDSFGSANV